MPSGRKHFLRPFRAAAAAAVLIFPNSCWAANSTTSSPSPCGSDAATMRSSFYTSDKCFNPDNDPGYSLDLSYFRLPSPLDASLKVSFATFAMELGLFSIPDVSVYETPIQARHSYLMSIAYWNCICAYSSSSAENKNHDDNSNYTNADCNAHWPGFHVRFAKEDGSDKDGGDTETMNIIHKIVEAKQTRKYLLSDPETSHHTSDARALCGVYAAAVLGPAISVPRDKDLWTSNLTASIPGRIVGLNENDATFHPRLLEILEESKKKNDREFFEPSIKAGEEVNGAIPLLEDIHASLLDFAECKSYSPKALGQIIALQIYLLSRWDGWNSEGLIRDSNDYNKCTANCVPYKDYSGYDNNRGIIMNANDNASSDNDQSGNGTFYWEPMEETDDRGLVSRTFFTVPQIGPFGVMGSMSRDDMNALTAPEPKYNYTHEVRLLLERMSELTPSKLDEIAFFDRKSYVVLELMEGLTLRGDVKPMSYEKMMWFLLGISTATYDSIIVVWKEKVRYNLIRPTTYIQKYMPNKDIPLWSEPSVTAKGRDFQATDRVMPHAEYPSGSACICQALGDFTANALAVLTQVDEGEGVKWSPPIPVENMSIRWTQYVPDRDGSINSPFKLAGGRYENLTSVVEACGISRLNAGLHFTASVPEGHKLCGGIGRNIVTGMMRRLIFTEEKIDDTMVEEGGTGDEEQQIDVQTTREFMSVLYAWQHGGVNSTLRACETMNSATYFHHSSTTYTFFFCCSVSFVFSFLFLY
ncbi:hypothetical protein ACHAXS_002330 [Conticribra weissflogii]